MKTTKLKHSPLNAKSACAARPKRRSAKEQTATVLDNLEQINLHAAGIDVGSAENFVCVPARSVKAGQSNVRSFGVFSTQQDDLVEWLKECGVTRVAMEATLQGSNHRFVSVQAHINPANWAAQSNKKRPNLWFDPCC